jgi:hypothetical protein
VKQVTIDGVDFVPKVQLEQAMAVLVVYRRALADLHAAVFAGEAQAASAERAWEQVTGARPPDGVPTS